MKLLGGRLGAVRLHPRFAGAAFRGRVGREEALARSGRVAMTLDHARGIVDAEVAAHNAGRLEKVDRASVHSVEIAERLDDAFARWHGRVAVRFIHPFFKSVEAVLRIPRRFVFGIQTPMSRSRIHTLRTS